MVGGALDGPISVAYLRKWLPANYGSLSCITPPIFAVVCLLGVAKLFLLDLAALLFLNCSIASPPILAWSKFELELILLPKPVFYGCLDCLK